MNKTGSDNTLHGVSSTDHWIRTDANRTRVDWASLKQRPGEREPTRLIPFVDKKDEGRYSRLGMAYLYYYREHDQREFYLDSALVYLTGGLARRGDDVQAYIRLGEAQALLGRNEEALISFRRALELEPGLPDAMEAIAHAFFSVGAIDSAVHYFTECVSRFSDDLGYLEGLGTALAEQGEVKKAVRTFERVLEIDNQSFIAHSMLGKLYAIGFNDPVRAIARYKMSLVLEPDLQSTRTNLGNAYVMLGDYNRAVAEYKEQLRRWPNTTEAYVNLGRVYALLGRTAEARSAYQSALRLSPNLSLAREALEQLKDEK
jgi:tetratricopeptide (TPR) repeat protein